MAINLFCAILFSKNILFIVNIVLLAVQYQAIYSNKSGMMDI